MKGGGLCAELGHQAEQNLAVNVLPMGNATVRAASNGAVVVTC